MNKNIKERDKIIFGKYEPDAYKYGGIHHFNGLDHYRLQKLIDKDFIDPEECQNYSPSTEEFLDFMKDHPEFTAHGYAVSIDRDDYRVTLEGIESDERMDYETMVDFVELCRLADDFCLDTPYAWWD